MDHLTIPSASISPGELAGNRVAWDILGDEVFFESDVELRGHAEAVGTAFFLQAMRRHLEFRIADAVCEEWVENLQRIMPLANKWWGFSPVSISARTQPCVHEPGNHGAFFTAGVDSFYTMLRAGGEIRTLIFIIGFDVDIEDTDRLEKVRSWIRDIAQTRGLQLVEVATNLKTHPFFRTLRWGDHTHGAALAAVGHALDAHFSELRIASTDVSSRPRGSNPELDHLWSSGRLRIKYDSPGVSRLEKVRFIVAEPLVRRYLRVCWENRDRELNCGRCEKCVRTQAQLWAADPTFFDDQSCFPPGDVPGKVDLLDSVPLHLFDQWQDVLHATADPALKHAIERLFRRSRRAERIADYKKAMQWYVAKLGRIFAK